MRRLRDDALEIVWTVMRIEADALAIEDGCAAGKRALAHPGFVELRGRHLYRAAR